MSRRNENVDALKAQLDDWNAERVKLNTEIAALKAQCREKQLEVEKHYQPHIEELKSRIDAVNQKIQSVLGKPSGSSAKTSKQKAQGLWGQMKSTLKETKKAFYEGLESKD